MADRPDQHAGTTTAPNCHRLFSIGQAADHADVPVQRIRALIRAKKLKVYHLEGGLRIDELELADLLACAGPS